MRTDRNIRLGLVLVGCNNLFFWMAPWLLFLLHYISFSQVAVIQAIGLLTRVVAEVPTGAIADLLGKKRTLTLAFLFTSLGEGLFLWRQEYLVFIVSFIIVSVGYSFFSGTMEAFMYDTLVAGKAEARYPKVLSIQQAVTNAAIATATLIGGFAYERWLLLPWVLTVVAKLVGLIVSLLIDEPAVDTDTFSWRGFIHQTRKGFNQLFATGMLATSILLLTYGAFQTFSYELLDDLAVIAFGYDAVQIGILYSVLIYITVPFSFLYQWVEKKFSTISMLFGAIGILVLNYIFSLWIGVVAWTLLFVLKVVYSPIKEAAITQLINTNTDSKIRATTISTYELVRKLPYLILAGFIGGWVDDFGVKAVAVGFALLLAILTLPQYLWWKVRSDRYVQ